MAELVLKEAGRDDRVLPIAKRRITIGKMPDNDVTLVRHNISRRHCQIFADNGRYFVRDLASRNGTFVGGARIETDTPISDGTEIHLGGYVLVFREGAPLPGPGTAGGGGVPAAVPERTSRKDPPVELKRKIHTDLIDELDLKRTDFTKETDDAMREKASRAVTAIVERYADEIPAGMTKGDVIQSVLDEALGLGPLEDLLADPEIDEIMVNNCDRIYVERKGRLSLTDRRFTDNVQLMNVVRRILAPIGRRVDEASPMVDARLKDGSRVNAIIPPLALTGPTLTIRKFAADPFRVEDLVRFGSLTPTMGEFLRLAVISRKNILISGGTGSGKTTLLNVLSSFLPVTERIVTIEDAAELRLSQDHVVGLEARPPNIEGEGAIPIRKLVMNALRMRPDRIVVGECRGGEALDMLQAMNTGHDGSLTTLHANSCRDALARLETLVLMAGMDLPAKSIRQQIASAVDIIVQIARISDGTRKVTSIQEVVGMEGEVITLQEIYRYEQTGIDREGRVQGGHAATGAIPRFVHELRAAGREIDMGMFT